MRGILVVIGLLLTAQSLYTMTGFTPQMDNWLIISSGVVQGLGLGLVFVPLSTVAFATLDARFRTDATACSAWCAIIGSSIGISIVTVLLVRNTQINHAELSAFINPFNPNLWAASPAAAARRSDGAVADRRPGQPPGDDDLLRQRLQADDDGDAGARSRCVFLLRKPHGSPAGGGAGRAHGLSEDGRA